MGSETTFKLPAIDFSSTELKPGNPLWETVKSQVRKAAEEYGCFEALFQDISQELRKAMDGALEEIFALPLEIKKLNVSDRPFHGYIGSSSPLSLYESIGFDDPDNFHKVESFTNIMWPQGNINFSTTVHSFSKTLTELDQMIRKMIVESFGMEKYLDEHMNSAYNIFRVTKYAAPETTDKKTGLRAHTDKNTTSILYQNQIDGLEIQTKDGEWINVEFSPYSFIVIIGESLNAWTNGRLHSPCHRVMMSGSKTRYSAVLFTVPKEGYVIKAVEELVDDEHPLQFKPFEYLEYLKLRYAEVGKNFESPLKAYFGA
ncbi:probable 2-oxoglutarate-dependent dioxygenase AOP1 [Ricinus communis]|uniref:Flavonol synthase/flavanone 3-hydroxylase, putative n=1 Tax=Ricinus communis TaxID=3988 RepID=B9RQ95_RICCO|nr:probable 2-oxoglutarate-dependent dioxygenase AOP1 [Ricinus communis]EEF46334.1 Flavonol synthase/flavanone 3-hydroxylase, putative [Ricinus communis]|eukprot:XP_002515914.1 probable 2-oxoglutarate-dependent dioxygenase AOP1 [Ricinus communis]